MMNLEISGSNPVAGLTCQAGLDLGHLVDLEQVPSTGDELRKHKNDRLGELMYSEEAQTFYFKTLPTSIHDHVVAAEHLHWVFSIPQSCILLGGE